MCLSKFRSESGSESEEWTDVEEEEDDEGSDVSWETENEETDEETDPKPNRYIQLKTSVKTKKCYFFIFDFNMLCFECFEIVNFDYYFE